MQTLSTSTPTYYSVEMPLSKCIKCLRRREGDGTCVRSFNLSRNENERLYNASSEWASEWESANTIFAHLSIAPDLNGFEKIMRCLTHFGWCVIERGYWASRTHIHVHSLSPLVYRSLYRYDSIPILVRMVSNSNAFSVYSNMNDTFMFWALLSF